MNTLIYDIEIRKAVPDRKGQRVAGIEYCEGWHDHKNMGVACIGAYDYKEQRTRLFMEDNLGEFFKLCCERDLLVGFNQIAFDDAVLATVEAKHPNVTSKRYDILVELWIAAGLAPEFAFPSHIGFSLDACGLANFGQRKTGNGASAPADYQRGRIGTLVDYCLNDIALTKKLFDRIVETGVPADPRAAKNSLKLRQP